MILKATICSLCILLVAVVIASYYVNKEGFDNITKAAPVKVPVKGKAPVPMSTPALPPPPKMSASQPTVSQSTVSQPTASQPTVIPPVTIPSVTIQSLTAPITLAPSSASDIKKHLDSNSQPAPFSSTAGDHALTSGSSLPPKRNDVTPEVSISDTGYTAMALQQKSDLLKDIQKIFRNELLANRATQQVSDNNAHGSNAHGSNALGSNALGSNAIAQGMEYSKNSLGCSAGHDSDSESHTVDMSQYIKKDAIPCWGCSLDY